MARTLIALYDDHAKARRALDALEDRGFTDAHLMAVSHEAKPAGYYRDADSFRPKELDRYDIPDDESHFYAEAVRRGGTLVIVRARDSDVEKATEALGTAQTVDTDQRMASYREEGFERYDASADAYDTDAQARERERFAEADETVKVVEEDLKVGKRATQRGGVRLRTHVVKEDIEEDLKLRTENVRVQRKQVDRPASDEDLDEAFQEKTVRMKEYAEEPVVEKTARVVEEIEVGKEVETRTEEVRDTVRRTEVEVIDLEGEKLGAFTNACRTHFKSKYKQDDGAFDNYQSDYRFGYRMADDDHDWNEGTMRKAYGKRYADRDWDRRRDAVRYGYDYQRQHTTT